MATPPAERAKLLRQCLHNANARAEAIAAAGVVAKGSYGCSVGEEMLNFMPLVFGLREYAHAMEHSGQAPPRRVTLHPGDASVAGRGGEPFYVAKTFPIGAFHLVFSGFKGEVWMQPGKPASQGALYRRKAAAAAAAPAGVPAPANGEQTECSAAVRNGAAAAAAAVAAGAPAGQVCAVLGEDT